MISNTLRKYNLKKTEKLVYVVVPCQLGSYPFEFASRTLETADDNNEIYEIFE